MSKRIAVVGTAIGLTFALWVGVAAWFLNAGEIDINPIFVVPLRGVDTPAVEESAWRRPNSLEAYRDLAERPAFSPSRRIETSGNVEANKSGTAEPTIVKEDVLELAGILITPQGRRALIRTMLGKEVDWYSEGAVVAGWKVITIANDHAVLIFRGGRKELVLYKPTNIDAARK